MTLDRRRREQKPTGQLRKLFSIVFSFFMSHLHELSEDSILRSEPLFCRWRPRSISLSPQFILSNQIRCGYSYEERAEYCWPVNRDSDRAENQQWNFIGCEDQKDESRKIDCILRSLITIAVFISTNMLMLRVET